MRSEVTTRGNVTAALRASMNRMDSALVAAGRELLAGVEQAFVSEGPGWAPLAESTVKERKRKGFGPRHPIQHRTGSYRRSWKGVITSNFHGDVLTISSADWRVALLTKSGRNRPARPVRIGPSFIKRATAAVRRALKG